MVFSCETNHHRAPESAAQDLQLNLIAEFAGTLNTFAVLLELQRYMAETNPKRWAADGRTVSSDAPRTSSV